MNIIAAFEPPGRFAQKEARALRKRISEADPGPAALPVANERAPAALVGKEVAEPAQDRKKSRRDIFQLYGVEPDVESISGDSLAETVASSDAEGADDSPPPLQFLGSAARCMVRVLPAGQRVSASMVVGPDGFARAVFPGEAPVPTEMPNLLLGSVLKRPSAAPQASIGGQGQHTKKEEKEEAPEEEEKNEEEEEEEEEKENQAEPGDGGRHRYTILFYKNGGRMPCGALPGTKGRPSAFGVRRCRPRKSKNASRKPRRCCNRGRSRRMRRGLGF